MALSTLTAFDTAKMESQSWVTLRFLAVCDKSLRPKWFQMARRNGELVEMIRIMRMGDEVMHPEALLRLQVVEDFKYDQRRCKGIKVTGGCEAQVTKAMVQPIVITSRSSSAPTANTSEVATHASSSKPRSKPYDSSMTVKYSGDDKNWKNSLQD